MTRVAGWTLALCSAAFTFQAQAGEVIATAGSWNVECDETNGQCAATSVLSMSDGTPVVSVIAKRLEPDSPAAAAISFRTPAGTLEDGGLLMAVGDGETLRHPYARCIEAGCLANVGLTEDRLAPLLEGSGATVTIYAVTNPRQPLRLDMPTAGLSDALDLVDAQGQ